MIVQRRVGDFWKGQYQFKLTPHKLTDFAERCDFQQTSSESHFTKQRVCTLPTEDGRITLSDLKFIHTHDGIREERMLKDEDEWRAVLAKDFGVRL